MLRMNEKSGDALVEMSNTVAGGADQDKLSGPGVDGFMRHYAGALMRHVPRLSETLAMQLSSGRDPTPMQLEQLANRMISYEGVPSTDITHNDHLIIGCFAGVDATEWLLAEGFAHKPSDALDLSDRLFRAGYFMGVDSSVRAFLNDDTLYCWNSEMMDSSSDEEDDDADDDHDEAHSDVEGCLDVLADLSSRNSFQEEPYARRTEQQPSQSAQAIAQASAAKLVGSRTMSTESWNIAVNHQVSVVCERENGITSIISTSAQRKASVVSNSSNRRRSKAKLRVRWNLKSNLSHHTYHPADYQRASWFDMDQAMEDWEDEEDDERRRQLEDRWRVFEQHLPPGAKCRERLHYERETARLAGLTRKAQERARRERVDVTQELLAYLHAADRLYNDLLAGTISIPGGNADDPASPDTPGTPQTPQSVDSTSDFSQEGDQHQQWRHQHQQAGVDGAVRRPRSSMEAALQAARTGVDNGVSRFAQEDGISGTGPASSAAALAVNVEAARQGRPQRGRVDSVTRAAKTWNFMLTQGGESREHRMELQEASALHRNRADAGLDACLRIEEELAQREQERRRQLEIERTQHEAAIRQEIERKRRERQRKRSGGSSDFTAQQQQDEEQRQQEGMNPAAPGGHTSDVTTRKRASDTGADGASATGATDVECAKASAQDCVNPTAASAPSSSSSSSSPASSPKDGRTPSSKSRPRLLILSPRRSSRSKNETKVTSMGDSNGRDAEDVGSSDGDSGLCDSGTKSVKKGSSASRFFRKSLQRLSGSSSDSNVSAGFSAKKAQKQQRKSSAQSKTLATLHEEHDPALAAATTATASSEQALSTSVGPASSSGSSGRSSSDSACDNKDEGRGAKDRGRSRLTDLIRMFERSGGGGGGSRRNGSSRSSARNRSGVPPSTSTSNAASTPASPRVADGKTEDANASVLSSSISSSAPSSPRERGNTVSRSFRKLFSMRRGGSPDEGSGSRLSSSAPTSPSKPKAPQSPATTSAAAAVPASPPSPSPSPRPSSSSSRSDSGDESGIRARRGSALQDQASLQRTCSATSPPAVAPRGVVGDLKQRLQDRGVRSEKKTQRLSLVPPVVVTQRGGENGGANAKTGVQAVRAMFEQREKEQLSLSPVVPQHGRASGSSSARGSTDAAAASASAACGDVEKRGSGSLVRARKNSYEKMVDAKTPRMSLVTEPGSLGLRVGGGGDAMARCRAATRAGEGPVAAMKKESNDNSTASTLQSSSVSSGRGSTDGEDHLAQTHDVRPPDSPSKWRRFLSRRKGRDKCREGHVILPLKDLQTLHHSTLKRLGIDLSAKEQHLSDEEFQHTFGCCKIAFDALPLWRQQQKKKIALLF